MCPFLHCLCVGEDITAVMLNRAEVAPACDPTAVDAFEYDENYVPQEVCQDLWSMHKGAKQQIVLHSKRGVLSA